MTATPFHIAGFFDGPWMFIVIVLLGAVINWLSKRREEKAAGEGSKGDDKSPQTAPADWEERLRRLLGEELVPPSQPRPPQPPRPAPAPPLRHPTGQPPVMRPGASTLRPPPLEVVPAAMAETQVNAGGVGETVRRFEQLDPAVMTPVRPISAMGGQRSRVVVNLRQRQVARQAFVASLVFGPPKGLEE